MANITCYAGNLYIDAMFRGQALGAPVSGAKWYFGLLTCTKGQRANSTAYSINDTVWLYDNNSITRLYKCTTAGNSASAQGTQFPGVPGEVINESGGSGGLLVWTEQSLVLNNGSGSQSGDSGTEATGGSYARVGIAASETNFAGTQGATTTAVSSGTSQSTSNNIAITFASPTGSWQPTGGMIWGVAVYDALTSGNTWFWAGLATPKTVNNGDAAPSFAISAWTFSGDNVT